ncbi:hypothetical protein DMB44_09050 [Thermoplasma sp. Kam2015]|nr:hypothetical protein DMB44_09050 [Thermoplasma sp. Kam2015]
MSLIQFEDRIIDIFTAEVDEETIEDIEHDLKTELTQGLMTFDDLSSISFSKYADIDSIREKIRSTGYRGEILCDPVHVIGSCGRKVFAREGDEIYIIDDLDYAAMKKKAIELWKKYESNALLNAKVREYISGNAQNVDSILKPYLDGICHGLLEDIHYTKEITHPDFPGHEGVPEISENNVIQAVELIVYNTI